MINGFLIKAKERLDVAEYQILSKKTETLGSTLYFALFNFMQSILGDAPDGKWKHIGILKSFTKYCVESGKLNREILRSLSQIYEDLYIYRINCDYSKNRITSKDIYLLSSIFEKLKEVIENEINK